MSGSMVERVAKAIAIADGDFHEHEELHPRFYDFARAAIEAMETGLLGLLRGQYSSLILSFNDESGPSYQSVEKLLQERDESSLPTSWVSEDEKQKAIATNAMWTLHWYPDTPVGFYALSASSLGVVLDAALTTPPEP